MKKHLITGFYNKEEYKRDGEAMALLNKPRKREKAGNQEKLSSDAAAFFMSLKGIRRREKAIRVQYGDLEKKDKVTGLKGMMVVIPIVMVCILAGVLWLAYGEFKKISPPADIQLSSEFAASDSSGTSSQGMSKQERLLLVVGLKSPVPEDFILDLQEYGGVQVDASIAADLDKLVKAAQEDGVTLVLTKGYVDSATQQAAYEAKVEELKAQGLTQVKAETEAGKQAAPGGKSEYQTGLTVDFSMEGLEGEFVSSEAYKWLNKNAVDYGFVLRYPQSKEKKTGRAFDPAHYRYVGKEAAQKMRTLGMCLEEYVAYIGGN